MVLKLKNDPEDKFAVQYFQNFDMCHNCQELYRIDFL